jgi:DNA-binding beta-propeller fold protein YncE
MDFKRIVAAVAGILLFAGSTVVAAEVDWQVLKTLKLESAPVDMAVSPDGQTIYVLTDQGSVDIFGANGAPKGSIDPGTKFDRVRVGQTEGTLYLQSSSDKSVQIVNLDFVQDIDISGSPFKGPEDAPVAIVVFSDFQ